MSFIHPSRLGLRFLACCFAFISAGVLACSVPVFRYALEHWASDPYQAVVLHRGALPETGQALVRRLQNDGKAKAPRANLAVRDVDLAQSPEHEMLDLWKQAGTPDAPWLVVLPPRTAGISKPVFSAALDDAAVNAVADSPARREIIKRLGEGESAVWVFLESGDAAKDDAAAKLIEARLAYLGGVLELPKLDAQDIKNGLVSVPPDGLRLAFSVLRIPRGDAAEKFFIQTLLSSEKDLASSTEPMAFPVFGQARVLYALVGGGIRHENIDRAASFLIGSCSCQVKEQNPGADLLVTADWKGLLKEQALGVQDLPKVSDIVSAMPENVIVTPREGGTEAKADDCCVVMSWVKAHRFIAAIIAVFVLLLTSLGIARVLRRRK